jgi:hypothetical protein
VLATLLVVALVYIFRQRRKRKAKNAGAGVDGAGAGDVEHFNDQTTKHMQGQPMYGSPAVPPQEMDANRETREMDANREAGEMDGAPVVRELEGDTAFPSRDEKKESPT